MPRWYSRWKFGESLRQTIFGRFGQRGPTLGGLASISDELLTLEVRDGCSGEVDRLLEPLRQRIRDFQGRYADESTEDWAPAECVCINLLRLGLLDELCLMLDRDQLPIGDELRRFLKFVVGEFVRCGERGRAFRQRHGDDTIYAFGSIVWGAEYIANFMGFTVRSMLSAGNLPRLGERGRIVFTIVTDGQGEALIRSHPVFGSLAAVASVEFITIPDEVMACLRSGHVVRNFYVYYGTLDHCSVYFAQQAGAHLFMIPVDAIVADGSLSNMAGWAEQGYECCGGGNIVANSETFLPALEARFPGNGPLSMATYDLASLAVEHAHHYFTSQIIAKGNTDFGKHPRELFWPVADGVEIHSVFIHPLFTANSALARYRRMHFANVDYGMIPRMFDTSEKIKIMDPDLAYVNNFTAAARLYETTGEPLSIPAFISCHDRSYQVQKDLFVHPQRLRCRLSGYEPYRDVEADVVEIRKDLAKGAGDTARPA